MTFGTPVLDAPAQAGGRLNTSTSRAALAALLNRPATPAVKPKPRPASRPADPDAPPPSPKRRARANNVLAQVEKVAPAIVWLLRNERNLPPVEPTTAKLDFTNWVSAHVADHPEWNSWRAAWAAYADFLAASVAPMPAAPAPAPEPPAVQLPVQPPATTGNAWLAARRAALARLRAGSPAVVAAELH